MQLPSHDRSDRRTGSWFVALVPTLALLATFPVALPAQSGASCAATRTSMTPVDWRAPASDIAHVSSRPVGRPLVVVADVPLPGAAKRFDYQSFDSSSGRLYISHMHGDRLDVFYAPSGRLLTSMTGFPGATGVLAVPEQHKVYVSVTGRHEVAVVDTRNLATLASITGASFPDGIAYAPAEQRVFVSDESGGTDLVIDARTNARLGLIALGGEAGNTHYDAVAHCIVVAVQTKNQIVAIDPASQRILQRYDVPCEHPHGFLIDESHRLAFVSCEGDSRLLVLDLRAMRTTATLKIPAEPDVLAFDPGLERLYVACESGSLAVFEENNGALSPLGEYRAPHAHTVAVDPATHRVYLPLQEVNGKPALRILAPPGP
jgi:sugar lactone lactonase YvrE